MPEPSHGRLDSWKAIADYLGRDVRTVIRWEKDKGLPIHRVPGGKRSAVFALPAEIDSWLLKQQPGGGPLPPSAPATSEGGSDGRDSRPAGLWVLFAAVAGLVTALAGALFLSGKLGHTTLEASLPPMRVVPITSYPGSAVWSASLSPDGKYLAFCTSRAIEKQTDLYVQLIGAGEPLRLTKGGAINPPAWSPDGKYIAFVRQVTPVERAVYEIPALGGREQKLGEVADAELGAELLTWSPDGSRIALADRESRQEGFRIYYLSVDSGEKKPVTAGGNSPGDRYPSFSPDGAKLAFIRAASNGMGQIFTMPAEGGSARQITADAWSKMQIAWTADSKEILFSSKHAAHYVLWRMPAAGGQPAEINLGDDDAYFPSVALKGNRLAYMKGEEDLNIWGVPLASAGRSSGSEQPVIVAKGRDGLPKYAPDGKWIAFGSNRSGNDEVWLAAEDGSNPRRLTFFNGPVIDGFAWSPNGKRIIVATRGEQRETVIVDVASGRTERFATGDSSDNMPRWSADGHSVYFTSARTGAWEIWRVLADGSGAAAVQVTHDGGYDAEESLDGKFLYFTKGVFKSGLWRMSAAGGTEELIVPEAHALGWALGERGAYFLKDSPWRQEIGYLDLATGRRSLVAKSEKVLAGMLELSPDGRMLLVVQYDRSDRDLMLAENFR